MNKKVCIVNDVSKVFEKTKYSYVAGYAYAKHNLSFVSCRYFDKNAREVINDYQKEKNKKILRYISAIKIAAC